MPKSITRLEIFIFLIILAIAAFWTWIYLKVPLDDAYVTLRYAQNFLQGHGLVFNVGEHVEAYSSYLAQVITCAGLFFGIPGRIVLQGQSIFFYFLTIAILTISARKRIKHPLLYFCVPVLYIFSLANNIWIGMGLETMLFAFLLLSSLIFYLELNNSRWQRIFVGLWCCLMSLSRPEAVAYYIVILLFEFVHQWIVRKRIVISELSEYSLGFGIFLFYIFSRWKYYGYLMPNTYYQKIGYNSLVWQHGFIYLKDFINYNAGGVLIYCLIITYGLIFRKDREWWLFFIVSVAFFIIVILSGGNYSPFWRYALPCQPILLLLIGDFFGGYFSFLKGTRGIWRIFSGLSISFLFCFMILQSSYGIIIKPDGIKYSNDNQGFHGVAKFTGLLFKEILYPNQSISFNALPFLSYYYGGWSYDPLGLTDAHIAHLKVNMGHMVQSHEKGDGYYILAMRPTIIGFGSGFNLVVQPNTEYPNPDTLYFISDIEIARQEAFKRLYEPYNIYVPAAGMYSTFFKLKLEELKPVSPQRVDDIYQDTIAKNIFSHYTLDIRILKNMILFLRPIDRLYQTVAETVTLRGGYER